VISLIRNKLSGVQSPLRSGARASSMDGALQTASCGRRSGGRNGRCALSRVAGNEWVGCVVLPKSGSQ